MASTQRLVNGQKFEIVTSFMYLGLVITDEDSKPEILSRIAQTTTALTRLKPVWNDRSISFRSRSKYTYEQTNKQIYQFITKYTICVYINK